MAEALRVEYKMTHVLERKETNKDCKYQQSGDCIAAPCQGNGGSLLCRGCPESVGISLHGLHIPAGTETLCITPKGGCMNTRNSKSQ